MLTIHTPAAAVIPHGGLFGSIVASEEKTGDADGSCVNAAKSSAGNSAWCEKSFGVLTKQSVREISFDGQLAFALTRLKIIDADVGKT